MINKFNKYTKILIFLFFVLLISFSCKNEKQYYVKPKLKDTLTLTEVEKHIDTIKEIILKEKKIYLSFYFGQTKDSVKALQNSYIKKGLFYKEKVSYDSLPHFFSTISLNRFNNGSNSNLKIKVDVRFNFEKNKLESMLLVLFSPKNYVPKKLKKPIILRSLEELEDNLIGKKNNIDFTSEMNEEKENINNISFIYIKPIFEDIDELYTTKYGVPIKIRNNDLNDQMKLLWLFKGKYIRLDFVDINNISKNYYDNLDEDILIGRVFYNTIINEAKSNRIINKSNSNTINKVDLNLIKKRKNAELNGI
jgi:hypothetical protein